MVDNPATAKPERSPGCCAGRRPSTCGDRPAAPPGPPAARPDPAHLPWRLRTALPCPGRWTSRAAPYRSANGRQRPRSDPVLLPVGRPVEQVPVVHFAPQQGVVAEEVPLLQDRRSPRSPGTSLPSRTCPAGTPGRTASRGSSSATASPCRPRREGDGRPRAAPGSSRGEDRTTAVPRAMGRCPRPGARVANQSPRKHHECCVGSRTGRLHHVTSIHESFDDYQFIIGNLEEACECP